MHEFSLYGKVSEDEYSKTLMQLAGVARMRPVNVEELRLVYKTKTPDLTTLMNNLPSAGGNQGVQQQEIQRTKTLLQSTPYYLQLVGRIHLKPQSSRANGNNGTDVDVRRDSLNTPREVQWTLEFKDIPDAAIKVVSSRLIYKIALGEGEFAAFFELFGFEYVSRYLISASEFYDDYTTMSLQNILKLPEAPSASEAANISSLPAVDTLEALDSGGGHVLHASITVTDGVNLELRDQATKQLLALKETFKSAILLTPGDRLALDTRVPVPPRRS